MAIIGLGIYSASVMSPNVDEIAHLAAGVRICQSGSFDFYKVNPPLVKVVAGIAVSICGPADCESSNWMPETNGSYRHEWVDGSAFLAANVDSMHLYWAVARGSSVLFTSGLPGGPTGFSKRPGLN